MEPVVYNVDSWHARLATVYGQLDSDFPTDICTYTKKVIRGLFRVVFFTLLIGVLSGSMVRVALYRMIDIANRGGIFDVIGMIVWGIIVVVCGIVVIIIAFGTVVFFLGWSRDKIMDLCRIKRREPHEENFVRRAFKSWKDKFCFPVELRATKKE